MSDNPYQPAADSWWRSRLVSDEMVARGARVLNQTMHLTAAQRARAVLAAVLPVNEPEPVPTQRITHGRHCTCTPCRVEDWTNPALAPCGMHGRDCPREYAPLGGAGQVVPVNEPETATPIPDSEFVEPPLMPSDPISERMIDVADDAFRSGSSDEQAWRECLGDALYAVYPLIREQVMAEASQGKRPVSAGSDGEDRPANPKPETDT